ncbi:5-formyltetrahydrofolate cyclo-ligase [Rhodococcus spongiicola]|uniref:5-formyltetrahydrofolate cyclo-ligase n=1 Tax=Rhodococcus spongiicola TaxID=2487352 RepID=A0A438B721_9NOCA|nr:5-formyltetrahydrofolate cyclo-ligase [Rhodococcus spongiicola]RVW06757.1 5-formyltetrahydrofolate cyclo-ligase [Rhodococcus spongiicola]
MQLPSKEEWRTRVLAARRGLDGSTRAAETAALVSSITSVVAELAGAHRNRTVCAYVPVGSEPGSVEMLASLRDAGWRVLLPVTGEPGPLEWAEFTGSDNLVPASYGLREPSGPVLPSGEVGAASVVFVPALAVDERGVRLGRGAGFYDRTLGLAARDAALVAVVRDSELVASLPADPHDVAMTHALTPVRGLVRLSPGKPDEGIASSE